MIARGFRVARNCGQAASNAGSGGVGLSGFGSEVSSRGCH